MTQGRSLHLFLVDGTPSGLLTAEIMNWTGHVLTGLRSKLSELVQRPECSRAGIYFLVGPDPENSLRPLVYIGESDDVAVRLKQHNRPEDKGGKDFWERVCLVTSKDLNLTKAHVKHLESLLIQSAGQVGRCKLTNSTAHKYINLPESDRADMAFFLEQIRTVLTVLGLDFLRETSRPSGLPDAVPATEPESSPNSTLEVPRHGIRAAGQEIDDKFYVFKGSLARGCWVGTECGYQIFSSPSAAAAVVSGRSANGREAWKVESSNLTYGEWQDREVSTICSHKHPDKIKQTYKVQISCYKDHHVAQNI